MEETAATAESIDRTTSGGQPESRGGKKILQGAFTVTLIAVVAALAENQYDLFEHTKEWWENLDVDSFFSGNSEELVIDAKTGDVVDKAIEATPKEIDSILEDLDIPPEQKDHIVTEGEKTFIVDDSGAKIAEIKEVSDVDSGAWFKAQHPDREYIIATLDGKKPFATAAQLKDIGLDRTGDVFSYTSHVSDDNTAPTKCITADQWKNNQLIKIEYGSGCGAKEAVEVVEVVKTPEPEPEPEPVIVPEVVPVQEVPCHVKVVAAQTDGRLVLIDVYLDKNLDDDFDDAGELIATSVRPEEYFGQHPERLPKEIFKHPNGGYYEVAQYRRVYGGLPYGVR